MDLDDAQVRGVMAGGAARLLDLLAEHEAALAPADGCPPFAARHLLHTASMIARTPGVGRLP